MRCLACETENASGRKFCAACGAALGNSCAACGHINAASDRFCGECGTPLTGAAAKPAAAAPDSELRPAVILFADLSGYTSHSSTADPEDVQELLNRFFEQADRFVVEAGGIVDKHIGDCVMAVFGAPVAHGDDAVRACHAARAILDIGDAGAGLRIHGGIAMGQVFAGATGSAHHGTYTVTGAAVNLAARLCDLAKAGEIVVASDVAELAFSHYAFPPSRSVAVDGLPGAITVTTLGARIEAAAESGAPFVGRDREIRQVSFAMEAVAGSGQAQIVELIGEAGIGKSRLVGQIAADARRRNAQVRVAQISSLASGRGANASAMTLQALAGKQIVPGSETSVVELATAFGLTTEQSAFAHELFGLPVPPQAAGYYKALGPEARCSGRAGLLETMTSRLTKSGPLLLVIEDIHWAEQDSVSEIAMFARMIARQPVLLLMTTRPEGDPIDRAWRNLAAPTPYASFDVPPLAEEDCAQLAKQLAVAGEFTGAIRRSGGNPLFLTQLIRHAGELQTSDLPDSIRSVVVARLDRLEPAARRTVQAASVLGTRFSRAELAHLLDMPAAEVMNLVHAQFIQPAGDQFEFIHALVRDAVYGTQPKSRRFALHARAASWFADKDVALEAHHLDSARDPRAPRTYLRAAAQAQQLYHHALAISSNARGLQIATAADDVQALMLQRGDILHESGESVAAIANWREALALDVPDALRCQIEIRLAQSLRVVDDYDAADAALERAEAIARLLGLNLELSRINFTRGNLNFLRGRIASCLSAHSEALRYARLAGDVESETRAYGGLGDAYYASGKIRSSCEAFGHCVELARRNGFNRIELANLPMLGISRSFTGDMESGMAMLNEAAALARRAEAARPELIALQCLSFLLLEATDMKPLQELLERADELSDRIGTKIFRVENLTIRAIAAWAAGNHEEARRLAREANALLDELSHKWTGLVVMSVLAMSAETAAERAAARQKGRQLSKEGGHFHDHFFFNRNLIEDALLRGEVDVAEECCDALEKYTGEEPAAWSECWIAMGRALARVQRGGSGAELIGEIRRLELQARHLWLERMAGRLAATAGMLEGRDGALTSSAGSA